MSINLHNTHILAAKFEYHAPESLEELFDILREHPEEATFLAGGTDLMVKMKQRLVEPKRLINLKKIKGLRGVEEKDGYIHIGALTKLRTLERCHQVAKWLPLLRETVSAMGSVQVRNMATIGGNLCNASPAADSAATLIALGADAHIAGPAGERSLPLDEFFSGPQSNVLRKDELLTSVSVPFPEENSKGAFLKIGRTKLDIATVNVAVQLRMKGDTIEDCRMVMGSVAPVPLRLIAVEKYLKGKKATDATFKRAGEICSDEIKPVSDVRATANYRKTASKGLIREALSTAVGERRECRDC
jgi:CO/xanthine dehydrogenase FAD-binding subunit